MCCVQCWDLSASWGRGKVLAESSPSAEKNSISEGRLVLYTLDITSVTLLFAKVPIQQGMELGDPEQTRTLHSQTEDGKHLEEIKV